MDPRLKQSQSTQSMGGAVSQTTDDQSSAIPSTPVMEVPPTMGEPVSSVSGLPTSPSVASGDSQMGVSEPNVAEPASQDASTPQQVSVMGGDEPVSPPSNVSSGTDMGVGMPSSVVTETGDEGSDNTGTAGGGLTSGV